jgi:hypothetical protein
MPDANEHHSKSPECVREATAPSVHRIGTRLTLSFLTVVALMAAGYGIALWQFRELRIQQQNLDRAYQESQAVLNLNAKLFALRDKLVDLADSQRGEQFASEASGLRRSMLNDIETAKSALQSLPPNVERNSFVLVSLDTIESTLPVQIDALSDLAKALDWRAIRLRSRSQVRQLTTLTSALVNTVAEGVAAERSRVLEATQLAESRVMLTLLGVGSHPGGGSGFGLAGHPQHHASPGCARQRCECSSPRRLRVPGNRVRHGRTG